MMIFRDFSFSPARLVFDSGAPQEAGAGRSAETAEVKSEKPADFKAEMDMKPGEWNVQVLDLLKQAMGKRYESEIDELAHELFAWMPSDEDYGKFQDDLGNIAKMRLETGNIVFLDDSGDKIATFEVPRFLERIIKLKRDKAYEICYGYHRERRARTFTRGLDRLPSADLYRRISETYASVEAAQEAARRAAGAVAAGGEIPQTRGEAEGTHNQRLFDLFAAGKADRQSILLAAGQIHEETYDIRASIDPKIQEDDAVQFERHWRSLDYSHQIDNLFDEQPVAQEGYTVNPFQGWNHEQLRELIQKSSTSELYFQEVAAAIYNDRFDAFKKGLEERKIPKVVTDLLNRDSTFWEKIPLIGTPVTKLRSQAGDLQETYTRLSQLSAELDGTKNPKDVPEKYKELWRPKNREKLKEMIQILGDYIAYATRLVAYVNALSWNPAVDRGAADKERTMHEHDLGPDGRTLDNERNHVIDALRRVFSADNPSEYSSELSYLFSSRTSAREITLRDCNGQVATVDNEWFTTYQSPDFAYKLAYEAAETEKVPEDGGPIEYKVDEKSATTHLNHLLELGISTYMERPGKLPVREIMDTLAQAGIEVQPGMKLHYSGNLLDDTQNLYTVLALPDLASLKQLGSEKMRLINAERIKFIRIGSVIDQKLRAREAQRGPEVGLRKGAKLALSPEQVETVMQGLRKTGKFDEVQLGKMKSALIGGAIVVLPNYGGAIDAHYEFENGVTLDITGALVNWNPAGGLAVGKKFDAGKDVTFAIGVAGGFSTGPAEGWSMGMGGRMTWKCEHADFYVEAGAGLLLSRVIPTVFVGTGLDWAKTQERFEKTLNKKEIETHVAELDKTPDVYGAVKANPSKYPEFAGLLARVQALKLTPQSEKDLFMVSYGLFKEGLEKEAVDDTAKEWYERFLPTGITLKAALVGNVPVPFIGLEFNLWNRKLVYRVAGNIASAEKVADDKATAAILAEYKGVQKIEPLQLEVSGEVMLDPTGRLLLERAGGESKIKFAEMTHLARFQEFSAEVQRDTNILVDIPKEPDLRDKGLIMLAPLEAHGTTRLYIDPNLKDDVVVVTRGGRLYISVKKDKEIFIKRSDIDFPFSERALPEETIITISGEKDVNRAIIERSVDWYMERTPKTAWIRRPQKLAETAADRQRMASQQNFKSVDEYNRWWGAEGKPDRLTFASIEGMQEEYNGLVAAVSFQSREANPSQPIRPNIAAKINALASDKAFLKQYKLDSVEGYRLYIEGKAKGEETLRPTWNENTQRLIKAINGRIPGLNEIELNFALFKLMVAQFYDIGKAKDVKKEYERMLGSFGKQTLKTICSAHLAEDPTYSQLPQADRDRKADEMVNWMIEQLKKIDMTTAQTSQLEPGTAYFLLSLVGYQLQAPDEGKKRLYNYKGEMDPEYGLVGLIPLDVKADGIAGEVARMWLKELSPYKPGLSKEGIPSPMESPAYKQYRERIMDALHSPLVLKLVPFIGPTLSKEELFQLKQVYEGGRSNRPEVLIYKDNIGPIRKLLELADKVREAQLAGKTGGKDEIKIDEYFSIVFTKRNSLAFGAYKMCGNPTPIMTEEFALLYHPAKLIYYAAKSEGAVDVRPGYSLGEFNAIFGAALPLPIEHRLPPPPPHKPPPVPPPDIPPTGGEVPPPVRGAAPGTNLDSGAPPASPDAGGAGE